MVDNEQIVEHLAFDRSWLKSKLNRSPRDVVLIEARGDSMEPTIHDGDLLLVDVTNTDIATSAIHVIELEGELLVKRLERRFDGSVLVHSDNNRYQPQVLTREDRPQLRIVGHVIWQGGPPR